MFQSMALEPSSQRQSMTSSIEVQPTIRDEEIFIQVEEIKQMLNEPLQSI